MKGGHFFYNYFKDMEEYLINFQKNACVASTALA